MWVDVDAEAVLLALADEGDDIVEVILVVFPTDGSLSRQRVQIRGWEGERRDLRSCVFDGFPGRDEAQAGESPPFQPLQVQIGFVQLEDPPDPAQVARFCALPEPIQLCAGLSARRLGGRGEVDAAQENSSAVGRSKVRARSVQVVLRDGLSRDRRAVIDWRHRVCSPGESQGG